MRVVFLASTLKMGGAERVTGEVSEGLTTHGVSVLWALLKEAGAEGERLKRRGLETVEGLGRSRFSPLSVLRLRRLLQKKQADALYCLDHQNAVVAGAGAAQIAGVSRRFLAVHTTGLWGGRSSLPPGIRKVLPSFTKIIAIAENQAEYLCDQERVPREKVIVIRNGIELARFEPTPERVERGLMLRESLGIASGAPVVGLVAALRPEKGHEVLFQAMERLLAANPSIRLVLVGDGEERGRLERIVEEMKLSRSVTFLGARDDVPDVLQVFDLAVLASHPSVETLPLALIEAMAAGRAVVATRVGSVEELVVDGVTGSLVNPGDPAALAGAILRLVGDRSLREGFARKGRERAKEFDIRETIAKTAALIRGEIS